MGKSIGDKDLMEIKVLSVSKPTTVSKGKNTWQQIEVEYQGKQGRKAKSLRDFADKEVFSFFTSVTSGQTVDVDVKKEGDFWNWKGAKVVVAGASDDNRAEKVSKGNWETSEERAARQRYIVRQSSITNAITLSTANGRKTDVGEILELASRFEAFVFGEQWPAQEEAPKPRKGRPLSAKEPVEDDVEIEVDEEES